MYLAETATRPAVETAIQKYVPESSSLTFIISRDLPVITTRSLLVSKVIPSRDHVILGGGAPVAWHCNCRVIPAVMMMSPGPEMLATGRAGGREGGERREGEKEGEKGGKGEKGRKGGRKEGGNLVQRAPGRSHVKYIPQNSMSCSESKFWPTRF